MKRQRELTWIERRALIRATWLEAMRGWAIDYRKCVKDGDKVAAKESLNQALRARRMAREVYA